MKCEISFDLSRIDFRQTSDLIMSSYWGQARTEEMNARAFVNSICVAAYIEGVQVGFGRAITDYCVFAYLADVIVWPGHRGRGIGKNLVKALLEHHELSQVEHWCLTTTDAQAFYAQFGFKPATDGRYMRREAPRAKLIRAAPVALSN